MHSDRVRLISCFLKNKDSVMIHEKAIVEIDIAEDTKVWAFTHILSGAVIGKNCNIGEGCFIESNARIGNNVTIKNGVYIWDEITIEDDVFVGQNASFVNDPYPRSKKYLDKYIGIHVEKGASIGANAVILAGVTIWEYAMVGAGAVVTHDVMPNWIVYGNPAKFHGRICKCGKKLSIWSKCKCGGQDV